MKRKLISIGVILALGCSFFSCEQNTPRVNKVEQEDYTSLNAELRTFTTSFNKENQVVQTKGFWKHFWKTIAADATGALSGLKYGTEGAVIGAVAGSVGYIAGQLASVPNENTGYLIFDSETNNVLEHKVKAGDRDYFLQNNEIIAGNMGEFHNICLDNLYPQLYATYSLEGAVDTKTLTVVNLVAEAISAPISSEQKQKISEDVNKLNRFLKDGNRDALKEYFKNAGLGNQYNVLEGYIDNISNIHLGSNPADNKEKIIKYTKEYLVIIKSSSIPKEDADAICSAIMVAVNSSFYWLNN